MGSAARIGLAVGWYDPTNPGAWSGVPRAVVDEVSRLATYAGHRNAMPPRPAARAVRRWLRLRGRLDDGWVLSGPMRALAAVTAAERRATTPRDVDGWIQLVGSFGRIIRGRYVTLSEASPSQLLAQPRWWPSFGYPDPTPSGMRWVAARQLDAHRKAFACCTASRWAAEGLIRDGVDPAKIRIVGYGANVVAEAPQERDWATPRFLFVGRHWARKNGDAVVRAFLNLKRERPAATLDVVGVHPPLEGIDGVTGHGPLSLSDERTRQQAQRLFARATCFVVPSFLEPFGIVYVEAANAGIASIGTSRGGTETSIGTAGERVDPDDEGALLDAMRLFADADVARSRGLAAADHARRLTWSATGERLVRSLELPAVDSIGWADFL